MSGWQDGRGAVSGSDAASGDKHQPWQANRLTHDGISEDLIAGGKKPQNSPEKTRDPPSTGFRNRRFCEIPPIFPVPGAKFGPLRVPLILRNSL